MNTLKRALFVNGVTSTLSGIILILFHISLMKLFEVQNSMVFWIIGIALLFFAATVFWEIKKQRPLAVLWIIIQDLIWVVGSAVLLIWRPFHLSTTGNILIGGMAILILGFSIFQSLGLAQLKRSLGKN